MNEQRKWFLEVGSTRGEGAVKTVDMTSEDLEYRVNFVHRAVTGFERVDSSFESSVGKSYQTALQAAEKVL